MASLVSNSTNDDYWHYQMQQNNYAASAGYLQQLLSQQNQGLSYNPNSPSLGISTKPEDEYGWLRRRVDEVCWTAA